MKNSINVKIPNSAEYSYPILVDSNLLQNIPKKLTNNFDQIVIITDDKVKKTYGKKFYSTLKLNGYNTTLLSFKNGERSKNADTKHELENKMFQKKCNRNTLLIALGGGVVGDLTGFIAATYMRGIAYIQIPTTLLAMVDSSIGGKTGINNQYGKTLVGAFWQPNAVIVDINCLRTLSKEHFHNGLFEILKSFLIQNSADFNYLQKNIDKLLNNDLNILKKIILKTINIKANVVALDTKENNMRSILNYGHTIGHAIEHLSEYKILHGFAVAYGMLVEAQIAVLLGFLANAKYLVIKAILEKLGIYGKDLQKWDINNIIKITKYDKKAKNNSVNYILLENIGSVVSMNNRFVHPVPDKIVKQAYFAVLGI